MSWLSSLFKKKRKARGKDAKPRKKRVKITTEQEVNEFHQKEGQNAE